jgi:hypothetical protein
MVSGWSTVGDSEALLHRPQLAAERSRVGKPNRSKNRGFLEHVVDDAALPSLAPTLNHVA